MSISQAQVAIQQQKNETSEEIIANKSEHFPSLMGDEYIGDKFDKIIVEKTYRYENAAYLKNIQDQRNLNSGTKIILNLFENNPDLNVQVYKEGEPVLDKTICCLKVLAPSLQDKINYQESESKNNSQKNEYTRVRFTNLHFYYKTNLDNSPEDVGKQMYRIYLLKLMARCYRATTTITQLELINIYRINLIIENSIARLQITDSYENKITAIKNILYNFIDNEKGLWLYIKSIEDESLPSKKILASDNILKTVKEGYEYFITIKYNNRNTTNKRTINSDEFFSTYFNLLSTYAFDQQEEGYDKPFLSQNGVMVVFIKALINDRFILEPNNRLDQYLFLSTYAYIYAGGVIEGAWGKLCIVDEDLVFKINEKSTPINAAYEKAQHSSDYLTGLDLDSL